jgi:hypothetical protein
MTAVRHEVMPGLRDRGQPMLVDVLLEAAP